jgi:hypothetical protein
MIKPNKQIKPKIKIQQCNKIHSLISAAIISFYKMPLRYLQNKEKFMNLNESFTTQYLK